MAKRKSEFGRPVHKDDVPAHLKGIPKTTRFLKNGTVEDYRWLGDDGTWDSDKVLAELTSPTALLRRVVAAIVEGNPSTGGPDEDRVEKALRQLLGRAGRKGRRIIPSDELILRRMSEEYLAGFYGLKELRSSASALAEWALQNDPIFVSASDDWRLNKIRTIQRKFTKRRDQLLAEFASAHDCEMQRALAKVEVVVHELEKLGVRLGTKLPELNP